MDRDARPADAAWTEMAGRRALITGISGQDGSYLAEQLLEAGYEVHGLTRRPPTEPLPNIEHLRDSLQLSAGDVRNPADLEAAVDRSRPDEIYHLASPSFVPELWERPTETFDGVAGATARLLELVRERRPETRVMLAGSREMFGDSGESPQRETSPCRPDNPYGIAKLAGFLLAKALRERDGLFVCSAILYNHESPRRPERFVTRKVTRAAAAIKLGLERELVLGDLGAVRDWCFAGDAMGAARRMLAHPEPGDYVVASGRARTVRDLVQSAFWSVGLDCDQYVRVDPRLVRPAEATVQVGDPTKARDVLGWEAEMGFEELIASMVDADLHALTANA
jgi:GDPmannose 4,6-dehydratase